MKYVSKNDAVEFKNAETCIALEYETGTPDINLARIDISGRYPEHGTAVNTKVTEIVYVLQGSGSVTVNGVFTALTAGDVISVAVGEAVFWEGELSLVIACSPAWYPGQYENT